MDIIKKYTHNEVTVVWKPGLCIHSGNCVRTLPHVFKPKEKPWVQPEGSTSEQLIDAVKKCPSGALTYTIENKNEPMEETPEKIKVNLIENGPAIVVGTCEITHPDGSVETRERRSSFCRCAKSANFPFCDGSHKNV
ncbi:MAG: (4Fe-4S)-binding protein [Flavobacteriaceae bacterium]|nr:(4Fe-4S)-binding protein [Flavobacteriaceae bacterium]